MLHSGVENAGPRDSCRFLGLHGVWSCCEHHAHGLGQPQSQTAIPRVCGEILLIVIPGIESMFNLEKDHTET